MSFSDVKIYGFNSLALAVSMANIDVILKVTFLTVSIGYTIHKWFLMYGKNK